MSTSKVRKDLNPEWVRQGSTVRDFREMRHVTLDELARTIGCSRPYLSNVEAGRKRLTPKLAEDIARVLAVRAISLLRPDEFPVEDAA